MHAALHAPVASPGASLKTGGWSLAGRCSAAPLPLDTAPRRRVAARAVGRLTYVSADGQLIEISEDDAPLEVCRCVSLSRRSAVKRERARTCRLSASSGFSAWQRVFIENLAEHSVCQALRLRVDVPNLHERARSSLTLFPPSPLPRTASCGTSAPVRPRALSCGTWCSRRRARRVAARAARQRHHLPLPRLWPVSRRCRSARATSR
jgi:hypothetical protein